jgi:hydroxymethylbilane synthase
MEDKKIKIGTRGSKLALWQAEYTQAQLKSIQVESELVIIKTKGDKIQNLSFDKLEGKGFFTKELEDALLNGEVDLAVHSMKDLPTNSPEGLALTAVSYRENPADWLLINPQSFKLDKTLRLKENAVVGTSSARRKAQMLDIRPDIKIKDIRGNVPTRIKKLRSGDFDAILLAAAGIQRLGLQLKDLEVVHLHPKEFVPAPAQGVLAFQTRTEDISTRRILKKLHQKEVAEVTNVERKVLNLLEGGCQMPLGVFCQKDSIGNYHVWAAIAEQWDAPVKRVNVSSSTSFELAETVVAKLRES